MSKKKGIWKKLLGGSSSGCGCGMKIAEEKTQKAECCNMRIIEEPEAEQSCCGSADDADSADRDLKK